MISKKKKLFDIIQIGRRDDIPSRIFDIAIVINIILNISVLFLDTFSELEKLFPLFEVIELITIIFFCIEYLLRIYTSEFLYSNCSKGKAALKFILSFDGIVDLLTILPFFFLSGFIAFRMLRVVRIFHLFRINSQYDSFNVITSVLNETRNQILSSVFIVIVLMMSSSLCMYSAEHTVQPDVFNNAFSGMWWSISTILTVGYGDIYPITTLGRVMAIIIALLGVGVVAIPTGIISAGFVEHYNKFKRFSTSDKRVTETCFKNIDDDVQFINKSCKYIHEHMDITITVIVRDGNAIIPNVSTIVTKGDLIIYNRDVE